ncbi:16S rRNA (adenine(1518)-N(6)/adenine(1519)-N(6))-dimethyltransferase RsmA [Candidatus Puniceispirillum sp.]|nr:16S rRNA (adenine(1518)-N(6)/adenine(1519)-N(6))-dimethyltransferase RsmA [Candidatus Puniceispirillum sp.]
MDDQQDLTNRIHALPPLRQLVEAMDLRARKSMGQNFLFDLNLTHQIARSAGTLSGTTIEVGPGPGGLTRALLLEGATHVIAIEKDRRAQGVLAGLISAAGNRLTLIEADAMQCPIWDMGVTPRRIIANLPYNIATALLISWLTHANAFESMTLMFQREVAERITAGPGDKAYGRLSVLSRWLTDSEILFDVPSSAFVPAPKVISSIVQIVPLPTPRFACSQLSLEAITRITFGQRRKMLRSSLKKNGGEQLLKAAAIDPEKRPQEINVEEFCRLALLYETQQNHQD